MNLFITGGTGFIGKKIIQLIHEQVSQIYLLVRPSSLARAKESFKNIPNITYIRGDILNNDVLEDFDDLKVLSKEIDSVLNLAAKYDLEMNELDAYTYNVIGVQNTLNLARQFKNLEIFHHVSTYAVSGSIKGPIHEDAMDDPVYYTDHYARSKMQGESVFRRMDIGENVKKRIYRPGIVIGGSDDGTIEKIDGPYYFLRFLAKNQENLHLINKLGFFPLPYNKNTYFPIIPVDYLAQWFVESLLNPSKSEQIRSYHFVGETKIMLKNFIEESLREFGVTVPLVRLKRNPAYRFILPQIGMPKELIHYMYSSADYLVDHRKQDFPNHKEFDISNFTAQLVQGCKQYVSGV